MEQIAELAFKGFLIWVGFGIVTFVVSIGLVVWMIKKLG